VICASPFRPSPIRRRLLLAGGALVFGAALSRQARASDTLAAPSLVWREDLGDPVLAGLLAEADQAAFDVKLAMTRVARADADAINAKAARDPQLNIGVDAAAGSRLKPPIRSAAVPVFEGAYEVDLWGRMRQAQAAAVSDRSAAQADLQAARLLIGATTAKTYVTLRAAQQALAAAARRRQFALHAGDLTRERIRLGSATSSALDSPLQALAEIDAEIAAARLEAETQAWTLGALLGRATPLEPAPAAALTPAPEAPFASTVIDQRPDVAAAYARLKAADHRRAEAVALSRPQLILGLGLGTTDPAIAILLNARSLAWALGASLSANVLNGRANRARIGAARADADTAELNYRKTVVQAWVDLGQAQLALAAARAKVEAAEGGLARAQRAAQVGQVRHDAGTIDGVGLDALQSGREQANGALMRAGIEVLQARIQRALAMGGQ
jgi:outer membrane protein TolC